MSNQTDSSGPNLAESMPAQAAEFAQVCKTNGIALDYLLRTLPLVDRFLNGKRGELQQLTANQDPQAARAPEEARDVDHGLPGRGDSPRNRRHAGTTTRTGRSSTAATIKPTR